MKGKTLLAKALAVAVAVTSILPSSALTAKAAPLIQKEEVSQWMHRDGTSFLLEEDNWLDIETDEKFAKFGTTVVPDGGFPTWLLTSSLEDGNKNHDMSAATGADIKNDRAPACIYASGVDITKGDEGRKVMRFVLYPQQNYTNGSIRLGIMLKYVDATHWAFLGYNGGNWWIQWQNGPSDSDGSWADKDKNYKNSQEVTVDNWQPAGIYNKTLKKDEHFRITLTYETAGTITLRMAPCVDENGKLVEKTGEAAETLLDFQVFKDLRKYAEDNSKQIHMGFVAGTDPQQSDATKVLTSLNIKNVMTGTLRDAEAGETEIPDAESENADDWVKPLELIPYANCAWKSPKGTKPENILKVQILGDGYAYAAIGDPESSDPDKKNPNATIYNKTVTDFKEGQVSAVLRPYNVTAETPEAEPEFYLGVLMSGSNGVTQTGTQSGIQVGMKGTTWGYKLDGGEFTEVKGADLPAIQRLTDYNIIINADNDRKVTAKVEYEAEVSGKTEKKEATLIGADADIELAEDFSGCVALTAQGNSMRTREVICNKISYGTSDLEEKYEELKDKNADHTYYEDIWEAFASDSGALGAAKKKLDGNNSALKPGDTAYDDFGTAAAAALQDAFDAIDTDENKVSAGKSDLQAAYDKIKNDDLTGTAYTKYYTTASIAAFGTARTAAKNLLDSMEAEDFTGITKTAMQNAIDSISKETALVPISLDKNEAVDMLDAALGNVEKYSQYDATKGNAYYNNWQDFADALKAVMDLKNETSFTAIQVDNAIGALEDAAAKLTAKTLGTALTGFQDAIKDYVIDEDVDVETYYEAADDAADDAVDVYKAALTAANEINGQSTVKESDEAKTDLIEAFNNIQLKKAQGTDKTDAGNEINAIVETVNAKKYADDDNWKEYQRLLKAAQDMTDASSDCTLLQLHKALEELREAQGKLVEDTTTQPPVDDGKKPGNNPPAGDNGQTGNNPPGNTTTDQGLQKDATITVGGATYTVVDPVAATVTLKTGNKTTQKVKIDNVTYEGKSYTVVGIGANAFKSAKMTSLTIGASVTTIGKNAFANCKKLKSVTIGKKVKSIGKGAFTKCTKLTKVTFKGTAVTTIAKNSFKGAKVKTVKVPAKLKKNKKFLTKVKKAGMKVNKLS